MIKFNKTVPFANLLVLAKSNNNDAQLYLGAPKQGWVLRRGFKGLFVRVGSDHPMFADRLAKGTVDYK